MLWKQSHIGMKKKQMCWPIIHCFGHVPHNKMDQSDRRSVTTHALNCTEKPFELHGNWRTQNNEAAIYRLRSFANHQCSSIVYTPELWWMSIENITNQFMFGVLALREWEKKKTYTNKYKPFWARFAIGILCVFSNNNKKVIVDWMDC